MYLFTEIETIFKNCKSLSDLNQAKEAFKIVIQDRDLCNKKIFFTRKLRRNRLREIEKAGD